MVPCPEQAEPGQVYLHLIRLQAGSPDGIPSPDTCKKSGDMPRCDDEEGVTGEEERRA